MIFSRKQVYQSFLALGFTALVSCGGGSSGSSQLSQSSPSNHQKSQFGGSVTNSGLATDSVSDKAITLLAFNEEENFPIVYQFDVVDNADQSVIETFAGVLNYSDELIPVSENAENLGVFSRIELPLNIPAGVTYNVVGNLMDNIGQDTPLEGIVFGKASDSSLPIAKEDLPLTVDSQSVPWPYPDDVCIIIELYSTATGRWEPFVLTPGPNCPPQD